MSDAIQGKTGWPASSRVSSSQGEPCRGLREIVLRHLHSEYRRPIAKHTARSFAAFYQELRAIGGKSLVLDAGCGVGESTAVLSRKYPESIIVGVDRSQMRISRAKLAAEDLDNVRVVRANLVDFWRLAGKAELKFERQYVLYPNPSPKKRHVKRRWHAHPVFPDILKTGGILELRTNWEIYAKEFVSALEIAGREAKLEQFTPSTPMTPFERKYHASGHLLYRIESDLASCSRSKLASAQAQQ